MKVLFERKADKPLAASRHLGLRGYINRCGSWRLIWELNNGRVAFRHLLPRDQVYDRARY